MSSNPKMPLGGATFPLFSMSPLIGICLLYFDLPLNVVFSCTCGHSRPISRVICPTAEPQFESRTNSVIRRHTASEPPMPAPVLCSNAFAALSEESLYDSPLNLSLSVDALAAAVPIPRARHHCLFDMSILSVIDSTVSVIPSGPEAEVKPANQD